MSIWLSWLLVCNPDACLKHSNWRIHFGQLSGCENVNVLGGVILNDAISILELFSTPFHEVTWELSQNYVVLFWSWLDNWKEREISSTWSPIVYIRVSIWHFFHHVAHTGSHDKISNHAYVIVMIHTRIQPTTTIHYTMLM